MKFENGQWIVSLPNENLTNILLKQNAINLPYEYLAGMMMADN